MFLYSFVFCCLGNLLLLTGAVDHMEILEERNIFKEFMKYPLNNPKKDFDLQVLSLHLRPATRNKSVRNGLGKVEQSPETMQLGEKRKDALTVQATPETNNKVPQSKRQKELEYGKYVKRKGRSRNRNKAQRPAQLRKPKLVLASADDEGYKEAKGKNLRSRRIELFAGSGRTKQPKGKTHSMSLTIKPTNEEFRGNWGDVGHLELPPMIDGEVLSEEAPLIYNQLEGEDHYSTQQVDVLRNGGEEREQKTVTWDGSREHAHLDHARHSDRNLSEKGDKVTYKKPSFTEDHLEETESSEAIANEHFNYVANGEHSSVKVLPTRHEVRDIELPPDSPQFWRKGVPIADIPIIDIHSDTIQPADTHTGGDQVHLWSDGDSLLQAEGSGIHDSVSLDHEDILAFLTLSKGRTETTEETQGFLMSQPTATRLQSSYITSPSPTNGKYTDAPRVTGSEQLLTGIFSPLEATMSHNSGPIYCKPGYTENGGVCKSQCDVGGLYCGDVGQCVIVENVGAMCRCQQMSSLCYGGECCRSSLTTFQLACLIGGCCILLSVFLASLPYLIRRMDIKAISKSVRTRLWISTLMPRSTMSSSSQSVDFTVCSDYASLSDRSTYGCTKEMARNSTVWQYERTRL